MALGECWECDGTASHEAIACPHCGAPDPVALDESPPPGGAEDAGGQAEERTDRLRTVKTVALLAAIGWVILAIRMSSGGGSAPPPSDLDSAIGAWTVCERAVEGRLASPATAAFPSFSRDAVTEVDSASYLVAAYVDAENYFGGLVRSDFICAL